MKLSRRKIAQYIAVQLVAGESQPKLVRELAAYIIDSGSTKQIDMILADIERELAQKGIVMANITTARKLTDSLRQSISTYVQQSTAASQVSIVEHVDESILGGVIIQTPGKRLDASVRQSLTQLRNI